MIERLALEVPGPGLHELTDDAQAVVARSGLEEGLCTLFVQHTSASLVIQENADPAVQRDLQAWLERTVPEHDPLYTHTQEGPDDMPSHVKGILTASSLAVPVAGGLLMLGTWQGIFLWEHRSSPKRRRLVIHLAA